MLSLITLPFPHKPRVITFLVSPQFLGPFCSTPIMHWPSGFAFPTHFSTFALVLVHGVSIPMSHPGLLPLSYSPQQIHPQIWSISPPKCFLNIIVLFLCTTLLLRAHQCCLDGSNSLLDGLPASSFVPF